MKDLKYLMAYTVPLSVVVSFYFGGVFSYTSLVYVFVFIPLVELLLPVQDLMFSENQINTHAGAYTLGHVLIWLSILLVVRNSEISPYAILLIFF